MFSIYAPTLLSNNNRRVKLSLLHFFFVAQTLEIGSDSMHPVGLLTGGTSFLAPGSQHHFTAHCTLHTAHCTLHTAHCTLLLAHCKLVTAHCILHTAHCTLHTAHGTLYTLQCYERPGLRKSLKLARG